MSLPPLGEPHFLAPRPVIHQPRPAGGGDGQYSKPRLMIPVTTSELKIHPAAPRSRTLAPSQPDTCGDGKMDVKRARRAERERELGDKIAALPAQRYGVIVADPPWRFEPYSRETGMDRAADNHYSTCVLDEIKALDLIPSIRADDCVLFLWATAPMLPQALEVMRAWGFAYKSNLVWVKNRIGTGYWSRSKHEHLLVGTRGRIPAPAMGTQWNSALEFDVTKHSAKPEGFLKMIEAYFPTLPKIELYRRGPGRPGWACWGLEAEPSSKSSDIGRTATTVPLWWGRPSIPATG
jgi:N6-adenosine-specific RNA methylase IME4